MTTYTISTETNWHSLTARAGGDTYNIQSGAKLTIDGDTRYGPNTTAATGVLGSITIDGTSGGKISITSEGVRLIPFTGGSGNVPAADTVISQGMASGKLLGVWSALNTAPTATGSAMPGSGFIKIRQTVGVFAAGALNGISATARRPDIPGWIEVVGVETRLITVPRLGECNITGDWFYAVDANGDTLTISGTRGQTIQLPSSVDNTYHPGVWIETGEGTDQWEIWPNASDLVSSMTPTDERFRSVWVGANGLMRVGSDGTNLAGFMPPTGARVRIPNILCANTNSTVGYAANCVPNSTLFSRFKWSAIGGTLIFQKCALTWLLDGTSINALHVYSTSALDRFASNGVASKLVIDGVCVSPRNSSFVAASTVFQFMLLTLGCDIKNVVAAKMGGSSSAGGIAVTGVGLVLSKISSRSLTNHTSATSAVSFADSSSVTASDVESIGFSTAVTHAGENVSIYRLKYASIVTGTVTSSISANMFTTAGKSSTFDGVSWVTAVPNTCHPYASLFSLTAGTDFKLKNVGSPSAPLDLGSINATATVFSTTSSSMLIGVKIQRVFFTSPRISSVAALSSGSKQSFEFFGSNGQSKAPSCSAPNTVIKAAYGVRPAQAAALGVHYFDCFTSPSVGEIVIQMSEPTTYTAPYVYAMSGTPKYDGNGTLVFGTIGDSYFWEQSYFAQGHTGFTGFLLTGTNTANLFAEYQIDSGSGWSTWKTANTANLTAEAINPVTGVKLRLRLTLTTGTARVTFAVFATTATSDSIAAINYPLDPVTITVNGLVTGSIVKVARVDTSAVLFVGSESGGQVSFTADYIGQISVEVRKASSYPYYQPWMAIASINGDASITALQVRDDQ